MIRSWFVNNMSAGENTVVKSAYEVLIYSIVLGHTNNISEGVFWTIRIKNASSTLFEITPRIGPGKGPGLFEATFIKLRIGQWLTIEVPDSGYYSAMVTGDEIITI